MFSRWSSWLWPRAGGPLLSGTTTRWPAERLSRRWLVSLITLLVLLLAGGFVVYVHSAVTASRVFTIWVSPQGSDLADGATPDRAVASLGRAQSVLFAAHPDSDVEVRIESGLYLAPPVGRWRFYSPGHTVSFLPAGYQPGGSRPCPRDRPVFQNKPDAVGHYPADTWLMPSLPTEGPLHHGGVSGLRLYCLRVDHYGASAISIDGSTGVDRATSPPLTTRAGLGLNGNVIENMQFTETGNKWAAGAHFGYGGIVLTNSSDNVITDNTFSRIENAPPDGGYIHGLYITHFSSRNLITGNTFTDVSSDVIKIRDRSDRNQVSDNTFIRAGTHSYYRDEFCDLDCAATHHMSRQCASAGNAFTGNRLVSNYRGEPGTAVSYSPSGPLYPGAPPCALPPRVTRVIASDNSGP